MRLGLKPHDPILVAAAPAHNFGLVQARPVVDRNTIPFLPGLYGNDIYSDCTAVALANTARAIALINGFDLAIEEDLVPAFYGACLGNPPDLKATNGAQALDVLQYQGRHGFDIGPQALVGNFGTVGLWRHSLALGIDLLGAGYWGVNLRERDMDTPAIWDFVEGRDDGEIVGGHMVLAFDYTGLADDSTVRIGTWGGWQPASWAWVRDRLQEAYGLVYRQLGRPDGSSCGAESIDKLYSGLEIAR